MISVAYPDPVSGAFLPQESGIRIRVNCFLILNMTKNLMFSTVPVLKFKNISSLSAIFGTLKKDKKKLNFV
jgi:hypothetical protein